MSKVGTDWMQNTLNIYSTTKYHIEYNDFLSNHIAFGIIALCDLGASREEIEKFIGWYETRLQKAEDFPRELARETNIGSLLGQRKAFYQLLEHYGELLEKKYTNIDLIIKNEFPLLTDGLAGSALHGLLQLGYGAYIQNERVVTEGLAYLHHSYAPLVTTRTSIGEIGAGTKCILSVLEDIGNDKNLRQFLIDKSKESGGFQERMNALLQHQGDVLLSYAKCIQFAAGLEPSVVTADSINSMCKWLIDCALQVYARAETVNDFFFIHGVTASWSFKQVAAALDPADAYRAGKVILCVLLAAYVTQKSPALTQYVDTNISVTEGDWRDLFKEVLLQIGQLDEHCFKLIQVSYDQWTRDPSMGHLYMAAARTAASGNPTFVSYS